MKLSLCLYDRFEAKYLPEPMSGCWLWIGAFHSEKFPYGKMRVQGKTVNAHRLSWLLHRGGIPEDMEVLHKCDVPACVNPNHLFLGTQLENMLDAVRKKRHRHGVFHGEQHPAAKLTAVQVEAIKLDKRSLLEIAQQYGVTRATISYIRQGKIWRKSLEKRIKPSLRLR